MSASDSRHYPSRPVVGVGALIYREGEVLLVERGNPPLSGYWSLPGGGVEAGERLEAAVEREVLEETGLAVKAGALATVFERIMTDHAGGCEYHYVLIDFYCTIEGGELRAGSDSRDARWFPLAGLGELELTAGTREVIESCAGGNTPCPAIRRP